ncbi:MAG: hypothetical protein HC927_14185 [Deltaproteobacteria bacterium]|nr:hypothetical protein [Deltaproteobacteria bacterium]
MDSARAALADGDTKAARLHFEGAFKLVNEKAEPSEAYCKLGDGLPTFGDEMLAQGDASSARIVYAYAIRTARACGRSAEHIDGIRTRSTSAREVLLARKKAAKSASGAAKPR